MEDVLKTFNLSDDNEIFRKDTTMIELYHSLNFITLLFSIQKILRFNLGVAFYKVREYISYNMCFIHISLWHILLI